MTCYGAAKNGPLDVLEWLKANGCSWNQGTCSLAANLDVLRRGRANGCPRNEYTSSFCVGRMGALEKTIPAACKYAAENGHLDVLKWVSTNGCP